MNIDDKQESIIKTFDTKNSWPLVPLGAKVKFLSGGTPRKNISSYWDGDIPWVSSGEMTQRRITDTTLHVTTEGAMNGTRMVPENTVLVVVRGMSLAKEFRVAITTREMTFNQDIKAIQPNDEVKSNFLFYYLLSQNGPIRDSASESAHGTKKLDTSVLEQWPLPIPPINIQEKITAVLSAYDDLIENNNKRIALLEKGAEALYREWFVRLRFPGWETAVFDKGIPAGWEVSRLEDIITIKSGKTASMNTDGMYKVYGSNGVIGKSDAFNTKDSIIIGRVGAYCGATRFDRSKIWATDNTLIVQAKKDKSNNFLCFFLLRGLNLRNFAGGAAQPLLTQGLLKRIEVLLAPQTLNEKFKTNIKLIFQQVENLHKINQQLTETRDMLLSRLISGKLPVDDLDIRLATTGSLS